MKKSLYSFLLCCFFICCLLSGCADTDTPAVEDKVIATVGNQKIWASEYERTRQQYEVDLFSEPQLLEGMLLEAFVYDQAEALGISASDEEAEAKLLEFSNEAENSIAYTKALEIYGTPENLKEAYRYHILYNKVRDYMYPAFETEYSLNEDILSIRTEDFLQNKTDEQTDDAFKATVEEVYTTAVKDELFNLYFSAWQYGNIGSAPINYMEMDNSQLFQETEYEINGTVLKCGTEEYSLEKWSLERTQREIGNIFYLPDFVTDTYDEVESQGVHVSGRGIRAAYMTLGKGQSETDIAIIIDPRLAFQHSENFINESEEEGYSKLTFCQKDIGVMCTLSGKADLDSLRSVCANYFTYVTPFEACKALPNNFIQVDISNISFPERIIATDYMERYDTETSRTEGRTLEEMIAHYGKDPTPRYIPENLTPSPQNDNQKLVFDKDGNVVEDVVKLLFLQDHDYLEKGEKMKGFSIQFARVGFLTGYDFFPDGECYFLMGDIPVYIYARTTHTKDDKRIVVPGYYTVCFSCGDIEYHCSFNQMSLEESVKVVASIIYETKNIEIINSESASLSPASTPTPRDGSAAHRASCICRPEPAAPDGFPALLSFPCA